MARDKDQAATKAADKGDNLEARHLAEEAAADAELADVTASAARARSRRRGARQRRASAVGPGRKAMTRSHESRWCHRAAWIASAVLGTSVTLAGCASPPPAQLAQAHSTYESAASNADEINTPPSSSRGEERAIEVRRATGRQRRTKPRRSTSPASPRGASRSPRSGLRSRVPRGGAHARKGTRQAALAASEHEVQSTKQAAAERERRCAKRSRRCRRARPSAVC